MFQTTNVQNHFFFWPKNSKTSPLTVIATYLYMELRIRCGWLSCVSFLWAVDASKLQLLVGFYFCVFGYRLQTTTPAMQQHTPNGSYGDELIRTLGNASRAYNNLQDYLQTISPPTASWLRTSRSCSEPTLHTTSPSISHSPVWLFYPHNSKNPLLLVYLVLQCNASCSYCTNPRIYRVTPCTM